MEMDNKMTQDLIKRMYNGLDTRPGYNIQNYKKLGEWQEGTGVTLHKLRKPPWWKRLWMWFRGNDESLRIFRRP